MNKVRCFITAATAAALLGAGSAAHAEHYTVISKGNGVFIAHASGHAPYEYAGHYKRRHHYKRHWGGHHRYWHKYHYWHKPRYWHGHRYGYRGYRHPYGFPSRHYYRHKYRHHGYRFGYPGWRY